MIRLGQTVLKGMENPIMFGLETGLQVIIRLSFRRIWYKIILQWGRITNLPAPDMERFILMLNWTVSGPGFEHRSTKVPAENGKTLELVGMQGNIYPDSDLDIPRANMVTHLLLMDTG